MSSLVLVLDQGGHNSRALVFDESGVVIAQAIAAVSTVDARCGWSEQDPDELVASLQLVTAQVTEQLGERCFQLRAAALIVQRSSIVAWNKDSGELLSTVLGWQDTRNSAWLENILTGHRAAIREKTGLYANAHYGASKMRWLLDSVPSIQAAAEKNTLVIAPLASYLQQKMTGSAWPLVDAVIASRTLLTELGASVWSKDLMDFFGIPLSILPAIAPTLADYGELRVGDCCVPLRLLGGDQSFFALSHGVFFDSPVVFINAGTGAFLQQKMPVAAVPDYLLCAPLLIADAPIESVIVAEGTVNAAASALDWLWCRIGYSFTASDWDSATTLMVDEPELVPIFINRVTASGSPDWLPAADSFFLTEAPAQLQAIAVIESVVFALQRNMDALAVVQPCNKIILSGGLSQLEIFCQRLADISAKPVMRGNDVDACARGAAMQLLAGTAGQQVYREFLPQASLELRRRYVEWTTVMDQLVCGG